MSGAKKIGVAMDFSETSKKALNWAIDNLLKIGDNLVVIHVLPSNPIYEHNYPVWLQNGSPVLKFSEFRDPEIMKYYDLHQCDMEVVRVLDTISRSEEVTVEAKLYYGDPREKLCQAVGDLLLNSIVMGSRGLGQLQRMLLGSVSNYVLKNAPCPVTLIKDAP